MSNEVIGPPLKALIERAERIEKEKAEADEALRELFAEVRSSGYDLAIFKDALKVRKQDAGQRAEKTSLLNLYLEAAK